MKEFSIRKAKKKDARAWTELNNRVWRAAYANIMPEEVFVRRQEETEERISRFSKTLHEKGVFHYVAVADKKNVGILRFRTLSPHQKYQEQGYADLQVIYIDAAYQNKGIGRAFFDLCMKKLKKCGCTKMVIGCLKENLPTRDVYEHWGGKLDAGEEKFVTFGQEFPEVFYLFDL